MKTYDAMSILYTFVRQHIEERALDFDERPEFIAQTERLQKALSIFQDFYGFKH